jgi:uncharacterized protein YodC (DUF2158 family)
MLKSGGPKMTVFWISSSRTQGNPGISCMWYVGEQKFEELRVGHFSTESLVVVKGETSS